MFVRFPPLLLLSAAVALSLMMAAGMLGLAMDQRWLGLKLTSNPRLAIPVTYEGLWIDAVRPGSPAATQPDADIPAGLASLVAIRTADGTQISLEPRDIIEEPDALPTYADMNAFFARQDQIAAALRQSGPLTLDVAFLGEIRSYTVNPATQRPVSSLPVEFWMQIGVGLAGFWIGAWLWALRRDSWATRCLFLTGAGLMVSAFPAAVYSTRELAIPGGVFTLLSHVNHVGALVFGMGMIGLFLVYPTRLVAPRWLLVPVVVLGAWLAVDILRIMDGPGLGFHIAIVLAMLAIIALVAIQYRKTKGDPRDRAALAWLGLAVIIGAGAFVATVIAPTALGIGAVVSQGQAFLFFLLIYVGVALGVARYRLFQLGEWAFQVLFYVVGVLLLLALDALLILTIIDDRVPAFALSLLIVALAWLPLRDMLARRMLRRSEPERGALFRQVMDVALTPPGRDQQTRWQALLQEVFRPLSITVEGTAAPGLINDGVALAIHSPDNLPQYCLSYADGGRRLFSQRDMNLATELTAMLANAIQSREAYEKGVAEERTRISRDIHDNIGVQLMGALHSQGVTRKDKMIRETLTDLRDIINNASNPDLSFEDMLADLRAQISEHLFAADVRLAWQLDSAKPATLPIAAVHTVRAVIREAVQNALKHGAPKTIRVDIRLQNETLSLSIIDDGGGFDPAAVQLGNGLANMEARVTSIGGRFAVKPDAQGTRIDAQFPVETERMAR